MARFFQLSAFRFLAIIALGTVARAETSASLPPAYRAANRRLLSSGLYAALESSGAFGHRIAPRPARSGPADLSKGKPPAVLDARVGPNLRLGDDPTALTAGQTSQAEPHITRSAANPDLLLATFQEGRFTDGGALDCGYAISRDGGLTWTRALTPQLTQSSGGLYRRATDPVAAIGPQGDLYLAALASLDDGFGTAAVVVSRSTDGGTTWVSPTTAFQQTTSLAAPDKDWIVVNDFPGTPNLGRLVCSWSNFRTDTSGALTGVNILISISDDRAASWSAPIAVTPANSANQGSLPVFLPDGSLVVIYAAFLTPGSPSVFAIQCKRSTDGGRAFPATPTTVVPVVNGWGDPDLRNGLEIPSAAVARQSGALVVSYTAVIDGTPRVMLTRSTNFGATWSAPVIASDNPTGSSVANPAVAVAPDGSTVSVVFIDKRLSPADADGHFYFIDHYAALSFDGGATWQPNLRLTEMSSDVRYAPFTSDGYMLGDYLGVAPSFVIANSTSSPEPFVAVWCETRTGNGDPFATRFIPSPSAGYETWAHARAISPAFFGDADEDGDSNPLEYANGTEPRVAESGESLFIARASSTTLDVAWTQRADVSFDSPELDRTSVAAFPNPNFDALKQARGLLGVPQLNRVPLAEDQLPKLRTRTGLVWKGWRFTQAAGTAAAIARTTLVTNGVGPEITGTIAGANTDSRLVNLSTRGLVGSDQNQLIVGFVLDGPKPMLIRAAGPALSALGVVGALPDPRLRLSAPASDIDLTNDNWQQSAATAALFGRLGAFPFANGSLDAALSLTLGPQSYSAIVSSGGTAAPSGLALVEAYDASTIPGAPNGPRLVNLSTRGNVGAGDSALIAGFVVSGTQPRRMLIRAVGPSLAPLGVSGALADPQLTLFQGATKIAANDDWEISRSSAAIAATAQRVGAFALNPASLDAALLITLAPGPYTVVVSGIDGTTGIALVEIYDAD